MTHYVRVHVNLHPDTAQVISDYIYGLGETVSELDPGNGNALLMLGEQIQRAIDRYEATAQAFEDSLPGESHAAIAA